MNAVHVAHNSMLRFLCCGPPTYDFMVDEITPTTIITENNTVEAESPLVAPFKGRSTILFCNNNEIGATAELWKELRWITSFTHIFVFEPSMPRAIETRDAARAACAAVLEEKNADISKICVFTKRESVRPIVKQLGAFAVVDTVPDRVQGCGAPHIVVLGSRKRQKHNVMFVEREELMNALRNGE